MPLNFQFGNEHHLYLLLDSQNRGLGLNSRPNQTNPAPPINPITYNTIPAGARWELYDSIRDVTVGGNDNTVDITTRDEARRGFSTEVIVTTSGEMSVAVRYKPRDDTNNTSNFGDVQDFAHEALLLSWRRRTEIAAVDLDRPLGTAGAQGIVSNWNVTFTLPKPVQGLVESTITFRMTTFPDWIIKQTSSPSVLDFSTLEAVYGF